MDLDETPLRARLGSSYLVRVLSNLPVACPTICTVPSVCRQCTFSVPCVYQQCTFSLSAVQFQCTTSVSSVYHQCTFSISAAPSVYQQHWHRVAWQRTWDRGGRCDWGWPEVVEWAAWGARQGVTGSVERPWARVGEGLVVTPNQDAPSPGVGGAHDPCRTITTIEFLGGGFADNAGWSRPAMDDQV